MNSEKGFTLYEVLVVLVLMVWLAVVATIIFVAIHFISKMW